MRDAHQYYAVTSMVKRRGIRTDRRDRAWPDIVGCEGAVISIGDVERAQAYVAAIIPDSPRLIFGAGAMGATWQMHLPSGDVQLSPSQAADIIQLFAR